MGSLRARRPLTHMSCALVHELVERHARHVNLAHRHRAARRSDTMLNQFPMEWSREWEQHMERGRQRIDSPDRAPSALSRRDTQPIDPA